MRKKKSASFLDQKGCHSTASPQVLDAFLLCKYLNHHQESISGIGPSYVTVIGQKVKVAFYKQACIEIAFKKKLMRGSESSVKMHKFKLHKRLYKPDYHPLTCVTLVFIRLCSDMCTYECLALLFLLL